MKDELLREYAELMIKTGIRVKPGQEVLIVASPEQVKLVRYCAKAAYEAGASFVRMEWEDDELIRVNQQYASLQKLGQVLPWQEEKLKERVKELPCLLYIESSDPDALKGVDLDKMTEARKMTLAVTQKYRDQMDNRYQWCIVAAAGKDWAKKVFPDKPEDEAVELLWEKILACVRLDGVHDANEAWEAHNRNFEARSRWLNTQKFTHLIYHSANGTDFTVGLLQNVKWEGGGETTMAGNYFNPNMPTEEIFTTPAKGKAEGRVVSTKPLSYQGQLITDFGFVFHEGKVTEVFAKQGEELLKKMVSMDEGAAYLGEVALVPVNSPINESGLLFYNTLFDENASCHLALGRGFSNLLEGYEDLSLEETKAAGINHSTIHVDFMIGSADMSITGVKADGSKVPVFTNGTWAFEV